MMTSKANARKRVFARLKNIDDRDYLSKIIVGKILSLPEIAEANVVAAYFALNSEVNIDKVIYELNKKGKQVCVPVTEEKLRFVRFTEGAELKIGRFGIREPAGGEIERDIDVIIVPMVAFDNNKNRLGHGKGYYDRYLSCHSALKIGVAFEIQEENFEWGESDIKMDIIVTEERILR